MQKKAKPPCLRSFSETPPVHHAEEGKASLVSGVSQKLPQYIMQKKAKPPCLHPEMETGFAVYQLRDVKAS